MKKMMLFIANIALYGCGAVTVTPTLYDRSQEENTVTMTYQFGGRLKNVDWQKSDEVANNECIKMGYGQAIRGEIHLRECYFQWENQASLGSCDSGVNNVTYHCK